MNQPRNKTAELRAVLEQNPNPDRDALCDLLDVDRFRLSIMISKVRRNPKAGTGAPRMVREDVGETVDVGSEMAKGPGDRREWCVNYNACLAALGKRTNAQGHCPRMCTRFVEVDKADELQKRARSGRAAA